METRNTGSSNGFLALHSSLPRATLILYGNFFKRQPCETGALRSFAAPVSVPGRLWLSGCNMMGMATLPDAFPTGPGDCYLPTALDQLWAGCQASLPGMHFRLIIRLDDSR